MEWKIVYAQSSSGRVWVREFILRQLEGWQRRIKKQLSYLYRYGPNIGPPITKKITGNLYELRLVGKNQLRILYTVQKNTIVLLHAFFKKSRRLPKKELLLAQNRIDNRHHI